MADEMDNVEFIDGDACRYMLAQERPLFSYPSNTLARPQKRPRIIKTCLLTAKKSDPAHIEAS
jgi:hypothetical protein